MKWKSLSSVEIILILALTFHVNIHEKRETHIWWRIVRQQSWKLGTTTHVNRRVEEILIHGYHLLFSIVSLKICRDPLFFLLRSWCKN